MDTPTASPTTGIIKALVNVPLGLALLIIPLDSNNLLREECPRN